jgi:hypothetical protein
LKIAQITEYLKVELMKTKIREFNTGVWLKTEARLKRLCGKPSPEKRLVAVIIVGLILAAANIYFVASSVYSIGKRDDERDLIRMQHIEKLELPHHQDSIMSIRN